MFENQMSPFQFPNPQDRHSAESIYAQQYNAALNRFRGTLLQGNFFRLGRKLLRRQPFLYDLNAIKSNLHVHGSSYAGIKVVPIHSIIGSEGRIADFDNGFHPINETTRERWMNIAIAHIARLPLPPIQLIEVGDVYFIRDGHHRVSVAHAFGQSAMDAEVITWNATPPFPWQPCCASENIYSIKSVELST